MGQGIDVIDIETTTGSGFGIIATNTWAAFKGADALDVKWGVPDYPPRTADMKLKLDDALADKPGFAIGKVGDVDQALKASSDIFEAQYDVPYCLWT